MENRDSFIERMSTARANKETLVKLNPIDKLKANPKSKAMAIKAMCFQCMGGVDADPGWRELIRNCTACKCALYDFRPYQVSK